MSRKLLNIPMATGLGVLAWASVASAHPGHGASGFGHGLAHPVTGLDHVLAMVGVGLLAAGLGRAWRWALPALFVGTMVAGAAAGVAGWFVPSWLAETGIAASVAGLGMMVTLGSRLRADVAAALTGVFAVFHGSAHAAEMPAGSPAVAFFAGFVLSTIFLHAVGLGLGRSLGRSDAPAVTRGCGVAMGVCGGLMLAGVL